MDSGRRRNDDFVAVGAGDIIPVLAGNLAY